MSAMHDPIKILADGTELPASDPRTDHVAVLFADGWMIATLPLATKPGEPFSTQQQAEEAAKKLDLLGFDDWQLAPSNVYMRNVIDHRVAPCFDPNFFPEIDTRDWYWTSTAAPWSSAAAFGVDLDDGCVYGNPRDVSGFGLACRRARQ